MKDYKHLAKEIKKLDPDDLPEINKELGGVFMLIKGSAITPKEGTGDGDGDADDGGVGQDNPANPGDI